jgi:hypothetical protein
MTKETFDATVKRINAIPPRPARADAINENLADLFGEIVFPRRVCALPDEDVDPLREAIDLLDQAGGKLACIVRYLDDASARPVREEIMNACRNIDAAFATLRELIVNPATAAR